MASWPENPRLIGTRDPPPRRPGQGLRQGQVPLRHPPRGDALRRDALQPARPRQGQVDRHLGRREDARRQGRASSIAKAGTTLRYQGDDIAAVAAETEEQARDAVRAIKVEYEVLPHVVTEAQAMADGRARGRQGAATSARAGRHDQGQARRGDGQGRRDDRGDLLAAGHHPRLPRAARPDRQVGRRRQDHRLGEHPGRQRRPPASWPSAFNIPTSNVTVLTEVMGGGFGSKFGADVWGLTAAELSKKARPAGQDVPRPRPGAPRRAATARAPRARSSSGRPRTARSSP